MKVRRSILVFLVLLISTAILYSMSPETVYAKLVEDLDEIILILVITVVAVVISSLISCRLKPEFVEKRLNNSGLKNLFYATMLGMIIPGPIICMYPIFIALKKKGVAVPLIVSFITGQTIIGPARILLEISILGWHFFIYRVITAIFVGVLAGVLFGALDRILPERERTNGS